MKEHGEDRLEKATYQRVVPNDDGSITLLLVRA
jgi:hypothetical protein